MSKGESMFIRNLTQLGWHFIMYSPCEYRWEKFDEEGNTLAEQGDETWNKDLDKIGYTPKENTNA